MISILTKLNGVHFVFPDNTKTSIQVEGNQIKFKPDLQTFARKIIDIVYVGSDGLNFNEHNFNVHIFIPPLKIIFDKSKNTITTEWTEGTPPNEMGLLHSALNNNLNRFLNLQAFW